jgi:hypothetical protein
MTLNDLMVKYGSDKAAHGFCEFYESFFLPVREDVKSVLEIGVADGASIRAWLDYFPNAEIWGMDAPRESVGAYGNPSRWPVTDRFIGVFGDQANRDHLTRLIDKRATVRTGYSAGGGWSETVRLDDRPWDIVIDDGGHTMEQQQVSLGVLFPHTRMFYVVEDLRTSFGDEITLYNPNGPNRSYPTNPDNLMTTYEHLWLIRDFNRHEVHEPEAPTKSKMTAEEWYAVYGGLVPEGLHVFDRDGDHKHMTSVLEVK